MFYIWTTPANLKIELKPSMSEIRNYLVANPIQNGGEEGEKRSIRILLSFDYRSKRNIGSRGGKIRVTMRWFVEIYRVCHAIRQISSLTWKGSGNGWTGRKGVTTNNLLSCSLPSPSPFVGRRESSDISFHLFVPLFVRIEQPSPLLQFETPSNLLLRTCLAFDPALPYCPHWYRRL